MLLPAIEKLEQDKDDANVNFDNGLVLVAFRCSECTYVEFYNLDEPL